MRHVINRFHIDIKNPVEGLLIYLQHRLIAMGGTSVVNHNIGYTKAIDAGLYHRLHRSAISDISCNGLGIGAERLCYALTSFGIDVGNNHLCTLAYIRLCHAGTKAATGTGDDGNFAC